MIVCGWCGHPAGEWETTSLMPVGGECRACGHEDPARPWVQRGKHPPELRTDAVGRPSLDPVAIRKRLHDARTVLPGATQEAIAEHLGISLRTLGRWQKLAD